MDHSLASVYRDAVRDILDAVDRRQPWRILASAAARAVLETGPALQPGAADTHACEQRRADFRDALADCCSDPGAGLTLESQKLFRLLQRCYTLVGEVESGAST